MATKCQQMMQNMIQETINQLEQNGALKISTEEAFALFEMEAPKKVSKRGRAGRPAMSKEQKAAEKERKAAEKAEKDALKLLAKAEKEATDAIAALKKRPKGRSPKGKTWDAEKGEWVQEISLGDADTPTE